MKKIFNKKCIFNLFILISFVVVSLIVCTYHEPWADEANPWLMARDSSIVDIFKVYMHSEGHPALWYLIIKLFQFMGLKYKYFFVIPVIFSSLGVMVFLFCSKYPWYIKVAFPFSYFIFYQYTVIARGYCLILLLLSLIACIYPKRHEKIFLYTVLLILLLSLESYTYLISGVLFTFYIIEFIRKHNLKCKEHVVSIIILFLAFLLTAIYVFPSSTYAFNHTGNAYFISDSFITGYNLNIIIKNIIAIIIIIVTLYSYLKKEKKYVELGQLFLLILPIMLFFNLKYYNLWHLGIIFEVYIFCLWIHGTNNSKIINVFLMVVLVVQMYWTFDAVKYDFKNNYSPGEEVASFIKENEYDEYDIYGLSYYDVTVNAYFDKNIYVNWSSDYAFFYIDFKSSFYNQLIDEEFIEDNKPDIIINSTISGSLQSNTYNNEDYNKYTFSGASYFETFKYEDMEIVVYVRKDIDKNK